MAKNMRRGRIRERAERQCPGVGPPHVIPKLKPSRRFSPLCSKAD
jgi:hypothetical protein